MRTGTMDCSSICLLNVKTWFYELDLDEWIHPLYGDEELRFDTKAPDIDTYLDLYHEIGSPWGWCAQLRMEREELAAILQHEQSLFLCMKRNGTKLGYSFNRMDEEDDAEILYFGILGHLAGQGLGKHLMAATLEGLRNSGCRRAWLHTCALDHPGARRFYAKMGFRLFYEEYRMEEYPLDFVQRRGLSAGQTVDEGFMPRK